MFQSILSYSYLASGQTFTLVSYGLLLHVSIFTTYLKLTCVIVLNTQLMVLNINRCLQWSVYSINREISCIIYVKFGVKGQFVAYFFQLVCSVGNQVIQVLSQ